MTTTRPITLTPDQVRAALAGRLEQVRVPVEPQPTGDSLKVFETAYDYEFDIHGNFHGLVSGDMGYEDTGYKPPLGTIGDRLRVRETWVELIHTSPSTDEPLLCEGDKLIEHATFREGKDGRKIWNYDGKVIAYRATSNVEFCDGDGFIGDSADRSDMPKWKSPVTMPRWASRITLGITGVRVERDEAGVWVWVYDVRKAGE